MSSSNPLILELMETAGAIRGGHFVLTSGRHADRYVLKDMLYVYPEHLLKIGGALANLVLHTVFKQDEEIVIAGAAVGGVPLVTILGAVLGTRTEGIRCVYAEKDSQGGLVFNRGYAAILAGQKVLLVEDVLTSGGTVLKLKEAVERLFGEVRGVVGIANRGNVKREELGVPWFETLVQFDFPSWAPDECPLCKAGEIPIHPTIGKGPLPASVSEPSSTC